MSKLNSTPPNGPNQWERKNTLIEYEVCRPVGGIAPLYSVRFPCGYGGTGATETEAVLNGIYTVRFFRKAEWLDAIATRFDETE